MEEICCSETSVNSVRLHVITSHKIILFIIKMMRLIGMRVAGHVERMREIRSPYEILVGKPEGKISLHIIWFGL
jgi:hypothetical protein